MLKDNHVLHTEHSLTVPTDERDSCCGIVPLRVPEAIDCDCECDSEGNCIPENSIIYYGSKDSKTVLTEADILQGKQLTIVRGLNYQLLFNSEVFSYLWFAEPIKNPVKTAWVDTANPFNKGVIGGDQDLFGNPVIVGGYRFYVTEYKTDSANPLLFQQTGIPKTSCDETGEIPTVWIGGDIGTCVIENGLRTGYFDFEEIKEVYADDLYPTGEVKPNVIGSADYIAPQLSSRCSKEYYNTIQSDVFTRNNCGEDFKGTQATLAVPAGKYKGSSQLEADSLAIAELALNGQAYANENGSCERVRFYNVEKSIAVRKNDCGTGQSGSEVTYTVPANRHSAPTQAEADALADSDILLNAQSYANLRGTCVKTSFGNVEKSITKRKDDCGAGKIGSSVLYVVLANKHTAGSQAEADALAEADLQNNSQAFANTYGTCTVNEFYNVAQSKVFTRNNCDRDSSGSEVIYTVPANKYSAGTQKEADAKAQADIENNGQIYANENGTCTVTTFYNTAKSAEFTRNNCEEYENGTTVTITVEAGIYSSDSQSGADALAQAELQEIGQARANETGSCEIKTYPFKWIIDDSASYCEQENETQIPDFDFLVAKYYWLDGAGFDLDTMTGFVDTGTVYDKDWVGWAQGYTVPQIGTNQAPLQLQMVNDVYLGSLGDNTGTGAESVLVNMKKFIAENTDTPNVVTVKMYAFWYGTRMGGDAQFELTAYKGGQMVINGYDLSNPTGEEVFKQVFTRNVTTEMKTSDVTRATLLGTITYNKTTKQASLIQE